MISTVLLFTATVIFAYILGSLNGAIITSRVFYRKDIRDYGSGNAGLTNTYRTFGVRGAGVVLLIDVLKTIVPVVFLGWLAGYCLDTLQTISIFAGISFGDAVIFGRALAGFSVMLGHCFPLFYRFKGGKGVMAIGVIVFFLDWRIALVGWGIFILIVLITRYVSLGSVIGNIALPVTMAVFGIGSVHGLIMLILCVTLIIIRHAPNIHRLFTGQESRISLGRKKPAPEQVGNEEQKEGGGE